MILKRGQVKITDSLQELAIHTIVWHLILSAVIVCILRVVFISGLD